MKKFINYISGSLVAITVLLGVATMTTATISLPVSATTPKQSVQDGVTSIGGDTDGRRAGAFTNLIENVINILLFVIGAVAVIMIIIGGIRYTTSAGDQSAVTGAKNTILYSVVGLVIAIMAYAIVNFVVTKL